MVVKLLINQQETMEQIQKYSNTYGIDVEFARKGLLLFYKTALYMIDNGNRKGKDYIVVRATDIAFDEREREIVFKVRFGSGLFPWYYGFVSVNYRSGEMFTQVGDEEKRRVDIEVLDANELKRFEKNLNVLEG
ncbi:hypothetical protein SIM22_04300 [Bacillus cereus group sp. BfR-BA-01363]|uniref:hypothetical protein n=1 Tax=Bacillus cereus group sp. BfR-BA-01363 TaxID=3094882 RepID=UPI0029C5EC09|nr:hypothetical protein [Bacillus cereus group sp. BfR-BA-01363]MDX5853350.1 hypothetical protein [Bacillus cereus group sp. BfR-BA-01363]